MWNLMEKKTQWGRRGAKAAPKPKKEFEEKLLEVRKVTRVTTGGRQMAFRATILIGNKKGKIWLGVATGPDVAIAVSKATHDAYKNVKDVIINDKGTVPYLVEKKFKSAIIRLIPAVPGTGLKAGSSVRNVLELAGYTNILSKIIGTNNRLNNALLAIEILSTYKKFTKNKGYHISGLALSQSSPAFEEAVVEETEAE